MFFQACSLQNEVGDPIFFTFLTQLTHHLTVVKSSEKKSMLENFRTNVLKNVFVCLVTGTCFKAAKSYDRASDAFKKAADAHYNSHSYPLPFLTAIGL